MKDSTRKRITIDLGGALLSAVDETAGLVHESRNRFIVASIEGRLRGIRNQQIDEAFAAMSNDPDYQREMLEIEAELAPLSDEAWRRIDRAEVEDEEAASSAHRRRRRGTR